MMPRYYLRFLGGAAKVHTLVGFAPSNHGTTPDGLFTVARVFPGAGTLVRFLCPACRQQERGSGFLQRLNAGADTVPRVHYTVIQSRNDEVVTPYTSAFLSGPNVTNITLQHQCPLDQGEHLSMPYDHIADSDVFSALDPAHPVKPRCGSVLADRRRLTRRAISRDSDASIRPGTGDPRQITARPCLPPPRPSIRAPP